MDKSPAKATFLATTLQIQPVALPVTYVKQTGFAMGQTRVTTDDTAVRTRPGSHLNALSSAWEVVGDQKNQKMSPAD